MRRFAFRLALKLGRVDVDKMLSEITYEQLQEWMLFAEMDPIDEDRMDQRFGAVIKAIYDVNRSKGREPFTVDECTPWFGDAKSALARKPRKTWQELKAVAMSFVEATKGALRR